MTRIKDEVRVAAPKPSGPVFLTRRTQNWEYNKRLVDALVAMAAEKKCTPAQLSIAWVGALGEKVIPLPGSSCVVLFCSRDCRALTELAGRRSGRWRTCTLRTSSSRRKTWIRSRRLWRQTLSGVTVPSALRSR